MRYLWLATRMESSVGVVDIDIDIDTGIGMETGIDMDTGIVSDIALGDLQACVNWMVWSMLWRRLRYTVYCSEELMTGDGYAFGMLFFFSSGREAR